MGAIGKHGWHEFGGGADGALELNGGGGSEKKNNNKILVHSNLDITNLNIVTSAT